MWRSQRMPILLYPVICPSDLRLIEHRASEGYSDIGVSLQDIPRVINPRSSPARKYLPMASILSSYMNIIFSSVSAGVLAKFS